MSVVEVKKIRAREWEDGKFAVYFTAVVDGEETETLEWLTEDGELEMTDDHLSSAHDFTSEQQNAIRAALNEYISENEEKIAELQAA
ncbi:hypothetical protein [Rhizobium sp. L245/93]|uniref:hypothetical protein n=1 Tax=Rhizobium sp. L245/93 TaxID=2819998 RepID=UPI001ADAC69E|nr:hypothetical protein [Rhizobium sp. L245/93]MBO9170897.1 hypothetical protein [Rhizobium sp. L245/93]